MLIFKIINYQTDNYFKYVIEGFEKGLYGDNNETIQNKKNYNR